MSFRLTLHFPPQDTKPAFISKQVRQSGVFKRFVTRKSRDFRYLYLDFKTEQQYKILKPILLNTLTQSEYVVEEVTT